VLLQAPLRHQLIQPLGIGLVLGDIASSNPNLEIPMPPLAQDRRGLDQKMVVLDRCEPPHRDNPAFGSRLC
jgi:hypothetical protein